MADAPQEGDAVGLGATQITQGAFVMIANALRATATLLAAIVLSMTLADAGADSSNSVEEELK